jgi:hypothetical protein
MSVKALNSVAGFSVGENPTDIILANGDITTINANLTGNLNTAAILTDNYFYANGDPLVFTSNAAGNNYEIQFNYQNQFTANGGLTYNPFTNLLNTTGDITANTVSTVGNITASYFIGNIVGNISGNLTVPGVNTSVIFNNEGNAGGSDALKFDYATNELILNGNASVNNLSATSLVSAETLEGNLVTAAQPNITSVGTLTTISVSGNANVANLNATNSINAPNAAITDLDTSNITTTGTISTLDLSATGNVGVDGDFYSANGTFTNQVSVTGNVDASILNLSGNFISQGNLSLVGNATIDGNVSANNLTGIGNISTSGNVSGNNLNALGNLSATGNVIGNNLSVSNVASFANVVLTGTIDGNLIPNANNSFSIGTSSNVWSNINVGNQGVLIGNTSITNVNGAVTTPTANITGNLTTSNLDISHTTTARGDVTILGNLTVSGTTEYINVTELSVMDPVISLGGEADGQDSAGYDGKDRGMLLRNYLEDGSAVENHFLGWKSSDREFIAVATVTDSTGDVITVGEFGNVRANTFKGNIEGTLLTAAQPNITSVGTLASLSLSGSITTPGTANVGTLKASGITYPIGDGDSGQVLTTNGAGDLFFASPISNQLVNGNSNVIVNANSNITVSVAGIANVINVTNNAVTVKGNVTANTVIANTNVEVGITNIGFATRTTSTIAPNQILVSVPSAGIRGVEFFIKGEESAGSKYSVETISAVHNGTAVEYSKYGAVTIGGLTGVLAVIFDSGNINLTVTAGSTNSTVWTTQYRTL